MKIVALTSGENNTREGAIVFLDRYEVEYLTGDDYRHAKMGASHDLKHIKDAVSNIGNVAWLKKKMIKDLDEAKACLEKAFFPLKGEKQ